MDLVLATLDYGDTSYIAKHNANYAAIRAGFQALSDQVAGSAFAATSAPNAYAAQYGPDDCLINVGSFKITVLSPTVLQFAPGFAWLILPKAVISSIGLQTLSFAGSPAGTYYVHIGPDGSTYFDQDSAHAFWRVTWSGSTFGPIATLVKTYTDANKNRTAKDVSNAPLTSIDVTLTAGESATTCLTFTGLLTASINVTLSLDDAPAIMSVKNATTGAFTLSLHGGTGTLALPQGTAKMIRNDGTTIEFT